MGTQHKNVSFVAIFTALACIAVYILTFTEFDALIEDGSSCSNTNRNLRRSPAVVEDMKRFNNTAIRTILRTPGFRWFDDALISPQNNIYLEKYKLHYCKIDKNMGSTMQDAGIYHFSIIRNPLSRFISAFVDICVNRAPFDGQICFGCGSNLGCFVPQLHDFLYKQSEHLPVQRWSLDWHFFPQSWYCDYDRHIDKYHFIRYGRNEQFWRQIVQVFRNSSVEPHLVSVIEEKLKTKTAAHATFTKSDDYEKIVRDSPILLEYLYKIYFLDFSWFGYRI
uniref:Carbohydrate sulfotransferase n=1 Tax=Plectus sambesii TaxID=2011161 RepID=A0A914ULM1_9BILA